MSDTLADLVTKALESRMAGAAFDPFIKVECAKNNGPLEVRLTGSRDGLLYLAKECLRVAESKNDWVHAHVDAGNIGDPASVPLTIVLEQK